METWEIEQMVIIGWYDGPTEGVCQMKYPVCSLYFTILGQRFDQRSDDRLYRVSWLPMGAVWQLIEAYRALGPHTSPIWAISRMLDDEEDRRRAEIVKDAIKQSAVDAGLIIRSVNMETFLDYWYDMGSEWDEGFGATTNH